MHYIKCLKTLKKHVRHYDIHHTLTQESQRLRVNTTTLNFSLFLKHSIKQTPSIQTSAPGEGCVDVDELQRGGQQVFGDLGRFVGVCISCYFGEMLI